MFMQVAPGKPSTARRDVAAIVVGLSIVVAGMVIVRNGTVSGVEESAFDVVNDLPGWLYPAVWPFQQLGALVLGPIVAVVALAMRRYRLALAAVIVTVLKLAGERGVKALVSRQRPGTSIGPDVEMRGDVHAAGESFVSGHAVLVAGLAGVVTPYLPGRWKVVPWVLVGAVMVGRVYVGAHNVLDVVCGAALGLAIAGAVNLALGVRRRRRAAERDATDGGAAHEDTTAPGPAKGVARSHDRGSPCRDRARRAACVRGRQREGGDDHAAGRRGDHRRLVRLHRERRPRGGVQPGARAGRLPGRSGLRSRPSRVRRAGTRRRSDRVAPRVRRYGRGVPQSRHGRTDGRRRRSPTRS